ncbi:MAG: glycosyltransferase family 39 protein [Gemmataceae bacterium]
MRAFLFLLALTLPLFLFRLGDRDFTSSHEARAAQDAQSMLSDGDWGVPHLLNRRLDLQKPPLFYWLVALLGGLGGAVNPWTVRLPAALSAVGCVLVVFLLGKRLGRPRAGFFAALILATSLHFTWLARVGRIDMPLTFCLTLAIAAHLVGRTARGASAGWRKGGRWFALGYLALAAAVLLKGPLAIVLFLLWQVGSHWLRWNPGTPPTPSSFGDRVARATWWWGYPLVLLLVAPWFLWANWKTDGELWRVFFVYHNFQRGLGTGENLASHPVWYYVPRLAVDLAPWSVLLPWAAWRSWRRRRSDEGENTDIGAFMVRISGFWFVAFIAFFSLMSFKRADYLLPAFPAFALLVGALLDEAIVPGTTRRSWGAAVPLVACSVCIAWLLFLQCFDRDTARGWFLKEQASRLRSQGDLPVIFFRAEAHALAFHVGPPLDTVLEWENLDVWSTRPALVVMPPEAAAAWPDHLVKGRLFEITRLRAAPDRDLVVFRTERVAWREPFDETVHARAAP